MRKNFGNLIEGGCSFLNSKERVKIALLHQEPDRVPVTASFVPEFVERLRKHLNLPMHLINPHGGEIHDLEKHFDLDIIQYSVGIANSYYASNEDEYTCDWGIKWKQAEYKTRFGIGRYTEIAENPLADEDRINNYQPPDPNRKDLYAPFSKILEQYGKDYYILGVTVCTIFEGAWYLRGLNRLLMDMVYDEEKANRILDIPFRYHLAAASNLAKMGADGVWIGDDVGTQKGMMISPEMWRQYLKPRMAAFCQELKAINPNLKIAYHSDGNIYPIIDELIEIGIDVLNPIQPAAMDPVYLKKRYGKNLAFWGTIDEQYTLPFGSVEDVRQETLSRIQNVAPGGGLILSPTHHIQLDTPIENFLTFLETVQTQGYYPIKVE